MFGDSPADPKYDAMPGTVIAPLEDAGKPAPLEMPSNETTLPASMIFVSSIPFHA